MKKISLLALAVLFIACSESESNNNTPPSNLNAVVDHYTVETTTSYVDSENTSSSILTANLQDEKFFSETYEGFINGESQGTVTMQRYFYNTEGLLIKRNGDNGVREFFYDAQQRLIGLTWQYETNMMYYRFVHVSDTKVFFERVNLPYDDPAATVSSRIVIELDADNNIVKAGRDSDLDGQANWNHQFAYDAQNNLIEAQEYGGIAHQIQTAPIKDTYNKILLNTYGRKNLMIYQAECYVNFELEAMRHAPDLRMMDTQQALIENTAFPYYFRKTKTETLDEPDGERTTVTTFYFE